MQANQGQEMFSPEVKECVVYLYKSVYLELAQVNENSCIHDSWNCLSNEVEKVGCAGTSDKAKDSVVQRRDGMECHALSSLSRWHRPAQKGHMMGPGRSLVAASICRPRRGMRKKDDEVEGIRRVRLGR